MNEIERLEYRASKLLEIIEYNSKKLGQHWLKDRTWDMIRIENTLRVLMDLHDVASMINELWEHPAREAIVGS